MVRFAKGPKKKQSDDAERDSNFFNIGVNSNEEKDDKVENFDESEEEENFEYGSIFNSKKFACSVCNNVFEGRVRFNEHLRNVSASHRNQAYGKPVTDKKEYECSVCKKSFNEKGKLDQHYRDNHLQHVVREDISKFEKCVKCEMRFVNKHGLEEHMKMSHPDVVIRSDVGKLDILPNRSVPKRQLDQILEIEFDASGNQIVKQRKKKRKMSNIVKDNGDEISESGTKDTNDMSDITADEDGLNVVNEMGKKKRTKKVCAVATCNNPQDSKYFTFPSTDEQLKNEWIMRCSRTDELGMQKQLMMCEKHFDGDCFLPDKSNKNGGLITKRLNRKMAIPTLELGKVFPSSEFVEEMKRKRENLNKPRKYTYVRKCAVKGCNNMKATSTHYFPNDKERQGLWAERCNQEVFFKSDRICGKHFSEDSFYRNEKKILMGISHKRRLKEDAVPTKFCYLNGNFYDDINESGNFDGNNEGNHNEEVQRDNDTNNLGMDLNDDETDNPRNGLIDDEEPLYPVPDDVNRVMAWLDANKKWKGIKVRNQKISSSHYLQSENEKDVYLSIIKKMKVRKPEDEALSSQDLEKALATSLEQDMINDDNVVFVTKKEMINRRNQANNENRINELLETNKMYEEMITNLRRDNKVYKKEVKRLSTKKYRESIFRQGLIKAGITNKGEQNCYINPGQKSFHYDDEHIVRAVVIRGISPQAYNNLRRQSAIPMPSRTTQERWLSNIPKQPGYQHHSIEMLKKMSEFSSLNHYNEAVLMFDEVSISQKYEMNLKTQTIYGNKSKLQVVMMRGLVQPWKEPIFYDFDTNMTKDLLVDIITKMEEAGFNIRAVVFDLGNKTWISKNGMKLKDHNYYIDNPVDRSRKVYCFPDVPHLLKQARTALLEKGFFWDGVDLRKEHFEEILADDNEELKCMFKLGEQHLNVEKGLKKQTVSLAAQLLSNSVSEMMKFGKRKNDVKWQKRSQMVKIFSDWFDTSNSRRKFGKNKFECGFGVHLGYQMNALHKMECFMNEFRVFDGRTDAEGNEGLDGYRYMDWWHGIIVQINALRGLYDDMVTNGELEYILCSRINQDALENYFSRFRAIHGDGTKPGPVEAMTRIRNLLFVKNAEFLVRNPSVQMEKDEFEQGNLNDGIINDGVVDDDNVEYINEFEQEEVLASSIERFTNDVHLEPNPSENIEPQNLEDVNLYPNDEVMMRDLSSVFEDNEQTSTIVIKGDFFSAKKFNCSAQGLLYILGFIAKKLKDKCPELGKQSKYYTQADKDDSLCTWLLSISHGKLFIPSDDFQFYGQEMEDEFMRFHASANRVDMNPGVIDRFTNVLVEKFGDKYDKSVYELFSRTRTHIRIKDLNKALIRREAHSLTMRDLKQRGQLISYKLAEDVSNVLNRDDNEN